MSMITCLAVLHFRHCYCWFPLQCSLFILLQLLV